MKTQQPTLITRNANQRRWLWLSLGLAAVVATLAISFYAARHPQAQAAQSALVQPAVIDPAAQGVNGYLRAHATIGQAVAQDAATQGVLAYLNAHRTVLTSAIAFDAAAQGVNGYLNAHRAAEIRPLDPAQRSVLDYLRAHSR